MTLESERLLDDTGWKLLCALQEDARLSYSDLGRRVGLTSPAVAERIRKMEDAGIILGYRVALNLSRVGLPVLAIIYLEHIGGRSCAPIVAELTAKPEVLECYRLTGSDAVILKVAATSVDHLAQIIDDISAYGVPNASIIRSRPYTFGKVAPEALKFEEEVMDQQAAYRKSKG